MEKNNVQKRLENINRAGSAGLFIGFIGLFFAILILFQHYLNQQPSDTVSDAINETASVFYAYLLILASPFLLLLGRSIKKTNKLLKTKLSIMSFLSILLFFDIYHLVLFVFCIIALINANHLTANQLESRIK